MTRIYLTIFFYLIFTGTHLNAQFWHSTWFSDKPAGLDNANLREVFFLDNQNGWAGGLYGEYYKTTDGGLTWQNLYHQFVNQNRITGIYYSSPTNGFTHAGANVQYSTINGGASWQLKSYVDYVNDIFYISTNNGWTVGNFGTHAKINTTTDGGSTWSTVTIYNIPTLRKVFFINLNRGWTVGDNGTILGTTDGGANWTTLTSGTTEDLQSVFFITPNRGWTVGTNGTILFTTDGGVTWAAQTSGTISTINDVVFTSLNNGWFIYSSGIKATTDGGVTWTNQTSSATAALYDIEAISATHLCAVGLEGNIVTSFDGGATWTKSYAPDGQFFGVEMIDESVAFAVGDEGAIKTTNGGGIWAPVTLPVGSTNVLYDVEFINSNTGWICGANGDILKTTDGGNSWVLQTTPTIQILYDLTFIDANRGWAVGGLGTILTTSNGGTTWTAQVSSTANNLYSVFFLDANRGWAGGLGPTLLTTINGGATWTPVTTGLTTTIEDIHFHSANTGFITGGFGIRRTTDGGVTWTQPSTVSKINAIEFKNANEGWIVGDNLSYRYTSDGGATWIAGDMSDISTPTLHETHDISLFGNKGIAVGEKEFEPTIFLLSCDARINTVLSSVAVTQTQDASKKEYFGNDNCGSLIARVYPWSTNAVSGNVTAKVWNDAVQNGQFVKRHYEIQPATNPTTSVAAITLYFTDADFAAFNSVNSIKLPLSTDAPSVQDIGKANLRIEKRQGTSSDGSGNLNTYTGTATTLNPSDDNIVWNGNYWEVTFNTVGFSGFWIKTLTGTLPLKLISFTGRHHNNNNILQWVTENEVNTDHFEIERSEDGITFSKIGVVQAAGNTHTQTTYYFTDSTLQKNYYFYRLHMLVQDGSAHNSSVIRIGSDNFMQLFVYPNPASEKLFVSNVIGIQPYQLYDASGRLLSSGKVSSQNPISIDRLIPGLYFIIINNMRIKFIKQ